MLGSDSNLAYYKTQIVRHLGEMRQIRSPDGVCVLYSLYSIARIILKVINTKFFRTRTLFYLFYHQYCILGLLLPLISFPAPPTSGVKVGFSESRIRSLVTQQQIF